MSRWNRIDAKGRSTGTVERILIVRRSLFHSPQFSVLSCTSRALFFELHALFNGTNNGAIFLSVRDATARLGFSDFKTAQTAFRELSQLGFITETVAGSFRMKAGDVSRARAWRLNWIGRDGRCAGPDFLPTLDFAALGRAQKRRVDRRQKTLAAYLKDYQRGQFAVEESITLSARMAAADQLRVEESTTQKMGNGEKPPIGAVGESTTHIRYHSVITSEQVAVRRARLGLAVIEGSLEILSNNHGAAAATSLAA